MQSRQTIILPLLVLFLGVASGALAVSSNLEAEASSSAPAEHLSPTSLAVSTRTDSQPQVSTTDRSFYLPLLAVQFAPPAEPQPVGPLGGTFTALAIDPTQNDNIYAGSFFSGVYKSLDRGLNWFRMSVGLDNLKIQSLATHPTSGSVVYAGTYGNGLYRSNNGGGTWFPVNGGVLDRFIIYDIEIDPNNPDTLYVTARPTENLNGRLAKSTDGGNSWRVLLSGENFNTLDYFYDVDVNPLNSNEIYLTPHQHGFYKSINGGNNFNPVNQGITDSSSRSLAFDPFYSGLVYGGVWHGPGAFISWNYARDWSPISNGLPLEGKVMKIFVDPFGGAHKRIFACTFGYGLYSSDNFGNNWNSRGLAGQMLNDFTIANGFPQRWYVALQNEGIFRSQTYGSTWIGSNGNLSLNNMTGLVAFPEMDNSVFAAIYGKGVFKVSDSGKTWQEMNQGLQELNITQLISSGGNLFALSDSNAYQLGDKGWVSLGLPYLKGYDLGSYAHLTSERASIREETLNDELTSRAFDSFDQASSKGNVPLVSLASHNGLIYSGSAGQGLWCLQEGGWKPCGLTGFSVETLWNDPAQNRLFASACQPEDVCKVFEMENSRWVDNNQGLEGNKVHQFAATNGLIFAATDQGIYQQDEAGNNWVLRAAFGIEILSLTSSPINACQLAAGAVGSTYFSGDCGVSWQIAEAALNQWSYQAVTFDPQEPTLVLFGSKEAGTYIWNIP